MSVSGTPVTTYDDGFPKAHPSLPPSTRRSGRGVVELTDDHGRTQTCRRKVGGTQSLQVAHSLATRVVDPTLSTAERAGGVDRRRLGRHSFELRHYGPAAGWRRAPAAVLPSMRPRRRKGPTRRPESMAHGTRLIWVVAIALALGGCASRSRPAPGPGDLGFDCVWGTCAAESIAISRCAASRAQTDPSAFRLCMRYEGYQASACKPEAPDCSPKVQLLR